jgi:hypothetical protein
MKKALIAIAAMLVTAAAFAQGQIALNNRIPGELDAPVTFNGGDPLPGAKAQLFLVGAGGALTPLTPATTFRTDRPDRARYVNAVDVDVPATPGSAVTVRLAAFLGNDIGAATTAGTVAYSPDVTIASLGGGLNPPSNLTGLQVFNVPIVPEPSTIVLGVLGAAALLFRRRK